MSCGKRIKAKRNELGLTQTELAEKVGVTFGSISKYEKDEVSIPAGTLYNVANALNVSVDYLLGNTTILNPKLYLEDILYKYNLTEREYEEVLSDILSNRTINLSLLNSSNDDMDKTKKAYIEIFKVYVNYLEAGDLDKTVDVNDEEMIKQHIKPIDDTFISMLKSLDKAKIIHSYNMNLNMYKVTEVPILGKISAGLPLLASENIEGYTYAPLSKIHEGFDYFYLRVDGDSMNLKFPDGCLVLVQKQPTLEKGQIGVFRVNGDDATVKRFDEQDGLIILEPMSTSVHKTQVYDPKKTKVEIVGKVVSYTGDVN